MLAVNQSTGMANRYAGLLGQDATNSGSETTPNCGRYMDCYETRA